MPAARTQLHRCLFLCSARTLLRLHPDSFEFFRNLLKLWNCPAPTVLTGHSQAHPHDIHCGVHMFDSVLHITTCLPSVFPHICPVTCPKLFSVWRGSDHFITDSSLHSSRACVHARGLSSHRKSFLDRRIHPLNRQFTCSSPDRTFFRIHVSHASLTLSFFADLQLPFGLWGSILMPSHPRLTTCTSLLKLSQPFCAKVSHTCNVPVLFRY